MKKESKKALAIDSKELIIAMDELEKEIDTKVKNEIDHNQKEFILKEKISKIPDENGFIIIIPICGACYNKITYFGKEINLEEEKYKIL